MKDWTLKIIRTQNGYILKTPQENLDDSVYYEQSVIQDNEKDDLKSHEELLWEIMEYFNFSGTKHDVERLRIIRQKRED